MSLLGNIARCHDRSFPFSLCFTASQHDKCPPQNLILRGVVGTPNLIHSREQDGLINLLVLAALHMDGLAVASRIGHEQRGGAGDGAGGLEFDAKLVHELPHAGQDGTFRPSGREGVYTDRDGGSGQERVEATRVGVYGTLGGSYIVGANSILVSWLCSKVR